MRRYTVAQLEAFSAIVECTSFRLAAERLGITQPTISLRIRDLEAAIGHPLFLRGKGGARLSEAGQVMVQYVHRGLDAFDEMELRLRTGDPLRGTLRLGSSNTFALSCLPALLAALEQSHPDLSVELTISNSTALMGLLAAHKLDVAFLVAGSAPPHVRIEPLASCEIAWFAGAEARLGSTTARPREFAARRIITLPPPSPLHGIIADWFTEAGVPLPKLSTCNDMATIVRLVRSGTAASILPLCIVDVEMQAGVVTRFRPLPALAPLTICAACHSSAGGHSSDIILRLARDIVARAGIHLTPSPNSGPAPVG
jgi:LysR family cyn operon transcriptional activator